MNKEKALRLICKLHTNFEVNSIAFNPDENHIAAGGIFSTEVSIFDIVSGSHIGRLKYDKSPLLTNAIQWGNCGNISVVHGTGGRYIGIWSGTDLQKLRDIDCCTMGRIETLSFDPSGQILAIVTVNRPPERANIWMINPTTAEFSGHLHSIIASQAVWLGPALLVSGHLMTPPGATALLTILPNNEGETQCTVLADKFESNANVIPHPHGDGCMFASIGANEDGSVFTTIRRLKRLDVGMVVSACYRVNAAANILKLFADESFLIYSYDSNSSPIKLMHPSDGTFEEVDLGTGKFTKGFAASESGRFVAFGVGKNINVYEVNEATVGNA